MKKNNKGFTLIELLAIIVILAIIAVITVPIILNIIENSRKGAATDSAYGYKDAVNKWYVTKLQEDNQFQLASSYTISSDGKLGDIVIPISGDKPSGGVLEYSNNTLIGGCLVIGDYQVIFDSNGNASETKKGDCSGYTLSGSGQTAQYGYKTYDAENFVETEIIIGTSGYVATGKNIYLKYALTNGVVAEGTVPEVCVYSDGDELCLKHGEFEISTQKIKTYFGYKTTGEGAWTNTDDYWENPEQTIRCYIIDGDVNCSSSTEYMDSSDSGYVEIADIVSGFECVIDFFEGGYISGCWYSS